MRPKTKQSQPGWTVEHQNCTVLATTPLDHKETFQSTRLWEIPGSSLGPPQGAGIVSQVGTRGCTQLLLKCLNYINGTKTIYKMKRHTQNHWDKRLRRTSCFGGELGVRVPFESRRKGNMLPFGICNKWQQRQAKMADIKPTSSPENGTSMRSFSLLTSAAWHCNSFTIQYYLNVSDRPPTKSILQYNSMCCCREINQIPIINVYFDTT